MLDTPRANVPFRFEVDVYDMQLDCGSSPCLPFISGTASALASTSGILLLRNDEAIAESIASRPHDLLAVNREIGPMMMKNI